MHTILNFYNFELISIFICFFLQIFCDLVVTTGGVSMRYRNLLRQVLVDKFGAEIHFARVNMKPGKPTTFATCQLGGRTRVVIGLPGNPVSASVTCHLYVLPAVRLLSGQNRFSRFSFEKEKQGRATSESSLKEVSL